MNQHNIKPYAAFAQMLFNSGRKPAREYSATTLFDIESNRRLIHRNDCPTVSEKKQLPLTGNLVMEIPGDVEWSGCDHLDCIPGCNLSVGHCERLAAAIASTHGEGE